MSDEGYMCLLEGCSQEGREEFVGYCSPAHGAAAILRGEAEPCIQCSVLPQMKQGLCMVCCDLLASLQLADQDSDEEDLSPTAGPSSVALSHVELCPLGDCLKAARDECHGYCSADHARTAVSLGDIKGCVMCETEPMAEGRFCITCVDRLARAQLSMVSTNVAGFDERSASSTPSHHPPPTIPQAGPSHVTRSDSNTSKYVSLVSALQQTLTCQLCSSLYALPHTLPCGHTACYACLFKWFTSSVPEGELVSECLGLVNRTCPYCRGVISGKPAEARELRDVVGALVDSGLVDEDEERREGGLGVGDAWCGMFG
ncbi:hypothetical protein JAAARDRAFT_29362 [Jaapia argillacea MUCL 33604]|uniref:RING-type domain-containing protein n=1 Tax=Jaapia argillacea MUCL 33604 TaxID=933084 RepID=A0A067QIJ5_9AGAM|nr:hypothetical protein JAAARDRAFT_29362 [Jaapia argillacea MUCL 33604]